MDPIAMAVFAAKHDHWLDVSVFEGVVFRLFQLVSPVSPAFRGLAGTYYGSRTLTEVRRNHYHLSHEILTRFPLQTLQESHSSPPLPGVKIKRRPSGLRDLLQDKTFVLLLVLYGGGWTIFHTFRSGLDAETPRFV